MALTPSVKHLHRTWIIFAIVSSTVLTKDLTTTTVVAFLVSNVIQWIILSEASSKQDCKEWLSRKYVRCQASLSTWATCGGIYCNIPFGCGLRYNINHCICISWLHLCMHKWLDSLYYQYFKYSIQSYCYVLETRPESPIFLYSISRS